MTALTGELPDPVGVFADAPPVLQVPGARERIRAARVAQGRRTAVLDDDPTGSQSVHDVSVVTALEPGEYAAALAEPASTCFVWTNSRSLPAAEAAALTDRAGADLLALGASLGAPLDVVTRSDSTLRGHLLPEVTALQAARRRVLGAGFDAVLLCPAYLEAGRVTAGDVHWARVAGRWQPVGETEFARDATFGYSASRLPDFVAERSGGAVRAGDVRSLSLEDVRLGGPDRVAQVLTATTGGAFVVVNATDPADLEVVVLGLQAAEAAGGHYLHRTGPSFLRALTGQELQPPLTGDQLSRPGSAATPGHGLVVVGSHVGLTSRQVARARDRGGLVEVALDVVALADPDHGGQHVRQVAEQVADALADSDVLLLTSRTLLRGQDADDSLRIARATSAAVVEVVAAARSAGPAWVVAKGGITSHDVAVRALGIRRARVLGQLLPGQVSVLEPVEAPPEVVGRPYVVFAGNVGDEDTLAAVVDLLRGGSRGGAG